MVKNKRKIKTAIVTSVLMLSLTVTAFTATTWSDPGTFSLEGTSWKHRTTANIMLGNVKTTDSQYYVVYTVSKTMWSSPVFRLVNSSNEVRSNEKSCASVDKQATGNGNTGTIGYAYYASMKASAFQSGTDTIKIQFKSN